MSHLIVKKGSKIFDLNKKLSSKPNKYFLSGIFLAMHYTPHIDLAFSSVEHIMRDVNNGWLIRYIHANGSSMLFIVVYCHIFRGLITALICNLDNFYGIPV